MKVVFSRPALAELDNIFACISADNPEAAERVVTRINTMVGRLELFPHLGRVKYKRVRMLPVPGLPYLIFYSIDADEVRVTSVRHSARRSRKPT